MKVLSKINWFLFLFAFAMVGCYYDVESELYPTDCEIMDPTYQNAVEEIITRNCAVSGCHVSGGTGPGDLTEFGNVQSIVSDGSFENRVLVSQDMPPNSSLTNCELQILNTWLSNGAN